jgi:hypothetical protein
MQLPFPNVNPGPQNPFLFLAGSQESEMIDGFVPGFVASC